MAIKRYVANADTTITNAFEANLTTRGTGSNMGASDSLEVFSIYGQAVSGSDAAKTSELSRILINFPAADIATDRTNSDIPASGSVSFYLRMFNAEHATTVPKNYTLVASAVTADWEEGDGLDMETYTDLTKGVTGSDWMNTKPGTAWARPGGDYDLNFASSSFKQNFDNGTEDIEMDITPLVEQWVNSAGNVFGDKSSARYGIGVFLTSSQEAIYTGSEENVGILHNPTGSTISYYTKKFFARGTEYFFKRPVIEARWDSSKKDNRGNFYLSSSLASPSDNLMKLYFYNYVKGQLKNIPVVETGTILVSLYSGSSANTHPTASGKLELSAGGGTVTAADQNTTASYVETGIYSASFTLTGSSTLTKIFDVWHTGGAATHTQYRTGSGINVKSLNAAGYDPNPNYVVSMPNLRQKYSTSETARLRVSARKKDWSPTIYTKASNTVQFSTVEDAYYKIYRVRDDHTAIDFGTGSLNHTRLSYDTSGSYFNLNMSLLEKGYMYGIKYVFYENGKYTEQADTFKFRVE